ncbi:hypothetical protein [Marihabitans asiaticum]|uniref:hypothetical protein n=1 Tax=Marihabitans asiaticum TaxID=415218 RepID=UPI0011AAA2A0|nr:hypothetical protein [Marihabitans asiaticum]
MSTPRGEGAKTIGQRLDAAVDWARSRGGANRPALLVVGLHLILVAWLVVPGGLFIDDFRAQAYAAGRGPWPFIIESNRTHLAPGPRTVDWLMAHGAPLEHWPAVVLTLLIAATLATSVWLLINELTTRRLGAVAGTVILLTSAGFAPSTAWFRQSLTTHAALALGVFATWATIRGVREENRRLALLPVVLLPLAYCFSERAVLFTLVIAWVHLVHGRGAISERLRTSLPVALPLAGFTAAFLGVYAAGDFDTLDKGDPSVGHFLASTGRSLFKNEIPALLGGPLRWQVENGAYSSAQTPTGFAAATCLGLLLVVLWRARDRSARRRIAHVAAPAGIFVLAVYVLIYFGRISRGATDIVDDLRLYPDVLVALGVTLAVVLDTIPAPTRAWRRTAAASVACVVGLSLFSWVSFGLRWHTNPSTSYVEALRSGLERDPSTPVLPAAVPDSIVPWWVQPDFSTEPLIALLSPETPTAVAREDSRVVSPSGKPVPGHLTALMSSEKSEQLCAAVSVDGQAIVRLPGAQGYFRGSLVRVGALVGDATDIELGVLTDQGEIIMTETVRPITVRRGPHTLIAPVPRDARVRAVVVRQSDSEVNVCLTSGSVTLPKESR